MLFGFAAASLSEHPWIRQYTILIYGSAIGCAVIGILGGRLSATRINALDLSFLGYFVWLTVSTALGATSPEKLHYLAASSILAFFPFALGRVMTQTDVVGLRRMLQWSTCIIMPLLILERYVFNSGYSDDRWVFFGQPHSPLLIGNLFGTSIIVWVIAPSDTRTARVIAAILIGLATIGCIWVGARGAFLCVVATLALAAMVSADQRRKILGHLAAVLIYSVVGFILLDDEMRMLFMRLFTVVDNFSLLASTDCSPYQAAENSVSQRLILYREALHMFASSPLFGRGGGSFAGYSCSGAWSFPHSTVLQTLAELGIFGFALLSAVWVSATMRLRLAQHTSFTNVGGVAMLLVFYLALDQIYGNLFYATGSGLLLGIVAGLATVGGHGSRSFRDGPDRSSA